MTTNTQRKSAWIPWIFIGGMIFVVLVNIVLIYLALSTWSGLETKDHYRKGIAYNENLKGADEMKRLGWTLAATVTANSTADKNQTVRAVYRDKAGAPIMDLHVRAFLVRPVHEGFDQTLELSHVGDGVYEGTTPVPLPGQWDLRLVALAPGGQTHQTITRFQVAE